MHIIAKTCTCPHLRMYGTPTLLWFGINDFRVPTTHYYSRTLSVRAGLYNVVSIMLSTPPLSPAIVGRAIVRIVLLSTSLSVGRTRVCEYFMRRSGVRTRVCVCVHVCACACVCVPSERVSERASE